MLKKQGQGTVLVMEPIQKKNRKKLKIAHIEQMQSLATCCHYFVGEHPNDQTC